MRSVIIGGEYKSLLSGASHALEGGIKPPPAIPPRRELTFAPWFINNCEQAGEIVSSLMLTDEERLIIQDTQPRAAELRQFITVYQNAALRLEVLAAFLKAGGAQPNMLYALELTDEVYEALTGQRLPDNFSDLDQELIEKFRTEARRRLGDA